jgi:hypothetical protein
MVAKQNQPPDQGAKQNQNPGKTTQSRAKLYAVDTGNRGLVIQSRPINIRAYVYYHFAACHSSRPEKKKQLQLF